jgi:hypothetical protein
MTVNSLITFVCCVESGALEAPTIRMIESLRRWGGQFASAPVFAVTPRFCPPLAKKTRQSFERLHVEYFRFHAKSRYSWFKFLNKPYALVAAQERCASESICWMDSDLLVVGEPDQLTLNQGEDFLACASDKNIGTEGHQDAFYPYWQKICQAVGTDIETLPWIATEMEGQQIRLYFNAGVFVYRRSTGFGETYLQTCTDMLDSRLASRHSSFYFTDQISLGLAMVKLRMNWRALPYSHNYSMGSLIHKDWYSEEQLRAARIVHYHDAMWPPFWPVFVKCIRDTHPPVGEWLSSIGNMKNEAPFYWRGMNKILQYVRAKQESAYQQLCQVI